MLCWQMKLGHQNIELKMSNYLVPILNNERKQVLLECNHLNGDVITGCVIS